MDSKLYKQICAQPNVFRLPDLQETLEVLRKTETAQAAMIATAILGHKVDKPFRHKGGHLTEFVALDMSHQDVSVVTDAVFDVEARSLKEDGEPTSKTGTYVHLVNEWARYRESLE